jgi:hypothetical protein
MADFQMPVSMKITGRLSSITNAFVNSIIPTIQPTQKDIDEAIHILGMAANQVLCAYCGDPSSEWDHLRAIVRDRRPTGYITEIHNLVPACGKCNQSKGNKEWRTWMFGPAKLSPATRCVQDIESKAARLETYEKWGEPTKLDIPSILGASDWNKHLQNLLVIETAMRSAQEHSDKIREKLRIYADAPVVKEI